MSVEFDTACCTAQPEDSLQLYIRNPASQRPRNLAPSPLVTSQNTDLVKSQKYSAVLNKFSGKTNWPSHGVVLPGNEILFSLETASDYVKGEGKDPNYGFKCLVTGYECQDAGEDGLKNLEHELAYLGGLCASSLMSKAIQLPNTTGHDTDKKESEPSQFENSAQELFDKFPTLLKKGFAIEHLPNVHQALAGQIPFSCQSHERLFLKVYSRTNDCDYFSIILFFFSRTLSSAAPALQAVDWPPGCSPSLTSLLTTAGCCTDPRSSGVPGPPSSLW